MSAYREGRAAVRRKPFMLLCARCGKRRVIREATVDTFVCEGCELEQPVFAVEGPTKMGPVAKSHQGLPDGVSRRTAEDLEPFARAMGVTPPVSSITVTYDGVDIAVEQATSSGTPVGVDLALTIPGFYELTLHRETDLHREAKRTGLTVELQTGDPEFDKKVFIESRASNEDLLLTFASPAVRRAVVAVLEHTETLELSAEAICLRLRGEEAYQPTKLRELLGALRTIAGAPRAVAPVTERTPRRVLASYIVLVLGLPAAIALTVYSLHHYAPFGPMVGLVALSFALVGNMASAPALRRVVAGRSRSHVDFAVLRGALLIDTFLYLLSGLVLYNGRFDTSAPRDVKLSAYEVGYDGEDRKALVYAMDGPTKHTFRFDDARKEIRLPATVTARFRLGRLGFPFQEGPATVHYSNHKTVEK